jgi:MFS family permease
MPQIAAIFTGSFHALKNKNFRYFLMGQSLAFTGTWVQRSAQIWLVYSLTNSPLLVGILGVCQFMPNLMFSLFAGVIADRFPKKRIIYVAQFSFMIQAFTMAFLAHSGHVRYWHVFIVSVFYGITQTVDVPTRHAFFFELVGKDDIMNAVTLNSTVANIAKIAGPALSGIIMVAYGPSICFFINGFCYIVVLLGMLLVHVEPCVGGATGNSSVFQKVKEGLVYIRNSEMLMIAVVVVGVVCTFAMNNDVVVPVFSNVVFQRGAAGYTALLSAAGFGSFCGAFFMLVSSRKGLNKIYLIVSGLSTATLQILTFLTTNYALCMLLVASAGFFNLVFLNTSNTFFQVHTVNEYRGRVMSVFAFLNQGSTPVGNFFAGFVMEHLGGRIGFLACGMMTVLGMLPVLIIKRKTIMQWVGPVKANSGKMA